MLRHFWGSLSVFAIALVSAFYFWGWQGVYIVALLGLLEVSLSFDNAVVNAKVLGAMDPVWQTRFIFWGIPIAVFGMRFLLPVLLVAAVTDMSVAQTFGYALNDPEKYAHALHSGEALIHAFGGAFLLMVALGFYFDDDRKIHWIKAIENNRFTRGAARIDTIELMLATAVGIVLLWQTADAAVGIAFFAGMLLYEAISKIDALLSSDTARNGAAGFVYLEILDASFSLDGVVGAFALSTNIYIIMLGLGVGALFVRSLTIFLVKKGTLAEYRYLEHGAHYAIFALAGIMLTKIFFEVSEAITGSIGAAFILIAFWHSVWANRKKI